VFGQEDHELTLQTIMPVAGVPNVDAPGQANGVVISLGGGITFTYTNLSYDEGSFNQELKTNEGEVVFEHKLIGGPGCLTIT